MLSALFVIAAMSAASPYAAARDAAPPLVRADTTKTVELAVKGVSCAACTRRLRAALEKIDGVAAVRAGGSKERIVVDYVAGRVTVAALVKACADAGFPARVVP